jgi:hypothetical protein
VIVPPASATPQEAAAIVAALERFLRDRAPAPVAEDVATPWVRTARLEGVGHAPAGAAWGDGHPWPSS